MLVRVLFKNLITLSSNQDFLKCRLNTFESHLIMYICSKTKSFDANEKLLLRLWWHNIHYRLKHANLQLNDEGNTNGETFKLDFENQSTLLGSLILITSF